MLDFWGIKEMDNGEVIEEWVVIGRLLVEVK
jgi:hypothetical protein